MSHPVPIQPCTDGMMTLACEVGYPLNFAKIAFPSHTLQHTHVNTQQLYKIMTVGYPKQCRRAITAGDRGGSVAAQVL